MLWLLSNTVKDITVQSNSQFHHVNQDIHWLNFTFHNFNELYNTVRQLEFALLQMVHQTDELIGSLQAVMLGKLPINLINVFALQNILRNVSLQLPEGYQLVAGTKIDDIHLYFEFLRSQ
jgi:hypothetical protein